jgi:2-polyprenyl-3-methyl-5-hydroxy-6-metoxy-1,4-benzoquinol methylase
LDVLLPLLKARAIMAAVRLGIFSELASKPLTPEDVARRRSLDENRTRGLLRVLTAAGYLRFKRGRFALTALARKFLLPGAAHDLTGYIEFNYQQWELIENLEHVLGNANNFDFHASISDSASTTAAYQRAMLELARMHSTFLAAHVPVPKNARSLLDLGGAHGLFGAAVCRAHPPLRALVLDLPEAVVHARKLAQEAGILDLVEHVGCDIRVADYAGPHDVILLANILHHFTAEERRTILARCHRALQARGTIAIWETEAMDPHSEPEFARDALALYFSVISGSEPCSAEALAAELETLGFDQVQRVRSLRAPGRMLVHARRLSLAAK